MNSIFVPKGSAVGVGSGWGRSRIAVLAFAMVVSASGITFTTGGVVLAAPSVDSVTVVRQNPTTAELTVSIANAGTAEKTVELRYRPDGSTGDWSTAVTFVEDSPASFNLTGLTQGTTYETQAVVYEGTRPGSPTWSSEVNFTTLPSEITFRPVKPNIPSGRFIHSDTRSIFGSFVVVDYSSPYNTDGAIVKNLYVRYYATSGSYAYEWKTAPVSSSSQRKPSFRINGLDAGTNYHLEFSLDSDFNYNIPLLTTTVGIATDSIPRVSLVEATDVTETSARIHVELDGVKLTGGGNFDLNNEVFWRYRVVGTQWPSVLNRLFASEWGGGCLGVLRFGQGSRHR